MNKTSCLILLIFFILQFESHMTLFASTTDPFEECFYEKRLNTSLNGNNDFPDQWSSDFDCFYRCLRVDHPPCRSFEHWRSFRGGMCIRTNASLADDPSAIANNSYVDYYEIQCRTNDPDVILPDVIECTKTHLTVIVKLNSVSRNDVYLGDKNCLSTTFNETHVQFRSQFDQCSLLANNGSVVGKLRWFVRNPLRNRSKRYERFFLCPLHLGYVTRSSVRPRLTSSSPSNSFLLPTDRRLVPTSSIDDQTTSTPYRITFQWTLHNQSFLCPETCYVSLHSFLNITLDDLSLISTRFFIDSCDLKALFPFTKYVPQRRLIHQGCSTDPTTIHLTQPTPLSRFSFSFYLYHILKEPIPFHIECKLIHQEQSTLFSSTIDCSSSIDSPTHSKAMFSHRNMKRNDVYTVFRSFPVYVTKKIDSISFKDEIQFDQNLFSSTSHTIRHSSFLIYFFLHLFLSR